MATTLTPRQREIKSLLDKGKTPGEVADVLEITENGVYQHMRRIREAGGTIKSNGNGRKSSTTRRSSSRRSRSSTRGTTGNGGSTPAPQSQPREMTPLQAIRHRKSEIEHQLRESEQRVESARKALAQEEEHHAKIVARLDKDGELSRLNAAESELTRTEKPKRQPSRRRTGASQNGKGAAAASTAQTAAPAAEPPPEPTLESQGAPAPVEEPVRTSAGAGVEPFGEATAVVEEERPGVPVDPEFEQPDGFADEG